MNRSAQVNASLARLRADEILDVPAIERLLEAFYDVTNIPVAIVETDSRILAALGWQDVCSRFHRANPDSAARCALSDRAALAALRPGRFVRHRCWSGLHGTAAPLLVGSRHVANLFLGPFFLTDAPVAEEEYRAHARTYGFDEQDYLAAVASVPHIDPAGLDRVTELYARLAGMIAELSLRNVELRLMLEESERSRELEMHNRALATVNALAIDLASATSTASVRAMLCARLHELTGAVFVGFGHYDASEHVIVSRDVIADSGMIQTAARLLGASVEGIRSPCPPELHDELLTGPRIRHGRSLAEASHGAVPAPIGAALQKVAGVDRCLSVALVIEGQLFGTMIVGLGADSPDPPPDLLESFASIGAVSLRRQEAEEALRESQEYARALFADSLVSLLVLDPETLRFLDCNDAALRLYGVTSRDQLIGHTPLEYSTPTQYDGTDSADAATEHVLACLRNGADSFEWRHLRPNGVIRHSEVYLSRIEHGARTLVQVSIQDITERKNAEDQFRALNAELERRVGVRTAELASTNATLAAANAELSAANAELDIATRAKSEFLASMSHELRTPLNAIIGFAGTLSQGLAGDLNEEQSRQARMISSSGRHLLELINQVLDLSRIEAGHADLRPEPFSVRALVTDVAETLRPLAEQKGLELRVRLVGITEMNGDGGRVRQVLINLVGNAIKFTERGSVEVSVRPEAASIVFAVADTGCGIAEADLPHIFDDFYQAPPLAAAKSVGTGLGLSVSRRLVEMMGGSICAESAPGAGSTFTVSLPADMSALAADDAHSGRADR